MAITRERKQAIVKHYRDLVGSSQGIVLASYSGLTVKDLERLRRKVRELGGEFHVVKNRLTRLTLKEAGLAVADEALEGSTAVGFARDEPLAVAKAIVDFSKESDKVKVKAGVVNGVVYDGAQMVRLAGLPPLPVLRAQLLGLFNTPATRLASILVMPARQMASVVKAYADKPAEAAA
ncbi:MAG: 50S ribosomal protein L10 [Chloroflexi bacterium]|nr:50S ribosomal protein L10 [Chloroflexota bacterium]